ncbi:MAG TPA: hypothetical protein VFI73_09275 [Candidatus Nitrosopolaris sp.]|nr:hypothetical protein [Candidatus Nitrosopolaris sp.]
MNLFKLLKLSQFFRSGGELSGRYFIKTSLSHTGHDLDDDVKHPAATTVASFLKEIPETYAG